MDDAALDAALKHALGLERDARAHWQRAETQAERTAALDTVRHVTVVIRSLEKWIVTRHPAARA